METRDSTIPDYASGENPIRLTCPQCGAPAQYSVADRVYRCAFCGADTPPAEQHQKLRSWQSVRRKQLRAELASARAVLYSCPGCGAQVAVGEDEATGSCGFCGGSLVRREFTQASTFPELIVPFRLTREEAAERAKKWVGAHGSPQERIAVSKNLQHLRGFYLPYQFVRGPIECTVVRDTSRRLYHCGGYVDEIAVNTSKQLKNEVLDAVEPFDWEETRPFHFGYIAGQRVKMQDIGSKELVQRVEQEVSGDYLPEVEKVMHTRGVSLRMNAGELEQLPVLLPLYIVSQKNLSLTVNGQTGAVAVSLNKTVNTGRFWFIEPLLTTLVIGLISFFLSKSLELALMGSAVVALVAFIAFGQDRVKHNQLLVKSSVKRGNKGGKRAVPVFREPAGDGDETVNVRISFFPLSRIVRNLLGLALFNTLPLLIAMFFRWSEGLPLSTLHFGYISLWLVISVPMTFIYWIAWLRRDVYDRPVIRQLLPDGKTKRLRQKRKRGSPRSLIAAIRDTVDLGAIPAFLLLFGLPLLMFIMSIVLMLEIE